jgi:hypothetical protein
MADMMPFDLEAQNQEIMQKRALQQALAQRALAPQQGQMIGKHYVGPGLGGIISALGNAAVSRFAGAQADAAQKSLDANRGQQLSSELRSYLDQRSGAPGQVMNDQQAAALMQGDQAPQLAEPVQANPREAIVRAMSSRLPELQAIGKADFGSLNRKPEFKDHLTQDGTLVRVGEGGEVKTLGNFAKPKDKFSDPYMGQGADGQPILLKRNLATNEVEPVDKGVKVTTNVDTKGELAALQAGGKQVPEVLAKSRDDIMNAQSTLQSAQRLEALAKDPAVKVGFAAGPAGVLNSLSTALGLTGPDAAAKTQAVMSEMANQTLNQVKRLPGAITEKERPFLEQAAAGKLDYTPEAIQHLAGLAQMAAHNIIIAANEQYNGALRFPGAGEVSAMYPLPPIHHTLDPEKFKEGARGRVSFSDAYSGGGAGSKGNSSALRGSAENPLTYEEYLQRKR